MQYCMAKTLRLVFCEDFLKENLFSVPFSRNLCLFGVWIFHLFKMLCLDLSSLEFLCTYEANSPDINQLSVTQLWYRHSAPPPSSPLEGCKSMLFRTTLRGQWTHLSLLLPPLRRASSTSLFLQRHLDYHWYFVNKFFEYQSSGVCLCLRVLPLWTNSNSYRCVGPWSNIPTADGIVESKGLIFEYLDSK